jgi:hypothetical protein
MRRGEGRRPRARDHGAPVGGSTLTRTEGKVHRQHPKGESAPRLKGLRNMENVMLEQTNETPQNDPWSMIGAGFLSQTQVEEFKGKNVLKPMVPGEYQGRRFAINISQQAGEEPLRSGPFRIEYFLFNDFAMMVPDWKPGSKRSFDSSSLDPEEGFSNVRVDDKYVQGTWISPYGIGNQLHTQEAKIALKADNNTLRGFIITLPETNLDTAITIGDEFIGRILDYLSFRKQIPFRSIISMFTKQKREILYASI